MFLYILVGFLAGILSGLLGLGGGVIMVPALAALFPIHHAIGTSMGAMVLTTGFVIFAQHKRNAIAWPYFKSISPGMILGGIIGAVLSRYFSSYLLHCFFALFCFFLAIKMFLPFQKIQSVWHVPAILLTLIAFFVGVMAGLLGVGGGIMLIPLLLHLGLETRQAMATSVTCVFPTVLIAAAVYGIIGYIHWPAVIFLGIGSLLGAPIGVRLVHYLPAHIIHKLFALLLLFIAWKMAPMLHFGHA